MNVKVQIAVFDGPIGHHKKLKKHIAEREQASVYQECVEVFVQLGKRRLDLAARNIHRLFSQDRLELEFDLV